MRIRLCRKDQGTELALFPFKTFVVAGFPFLKFFRAYTDTVITLHYDRGYLTLQISALYLLSIFVLMLGAFVQWASCHFDGAKLTVVFATAGFVFFRMLSPWGLVS